nr:uncharacterized protein LOC113723905 [Coffea arabica]
MVSQKNLVSWVASFMTFLITKSPTAYAEKDHSLATTRAPAPSESSKFAMEFCNKISSKEGREFCMRVLASNPRSASAKGFVDLLHISIDITVRYANITKEYMASLLNSNTAKGEFLPALKQCISDYDAGIRELLLITKDMVDDPALASYDAVVASDQLGYCEEALKSDNVVDRSILSKHKIAKASVLLCVDVANHIN